MNQQQLLQVQGVLEDVKYERERQFKKWGYLDIQPSYYALILGEEVGEVNKEIIERHWQGLNPEDAALLRKELIQVAAVAVQFVEWIDDRVRQNETKSITSQVATGLPVSNSLDGCPFHYCDSKPVCEKRCRYDRSQY